jgi:hypothetical protein
VVVVLVGVAAGRVVFVVVVVVVFESAWSR